MASLRSAAAPASSAPERPVLPLDQDEDDVEAAAQPWIGCLGAEGGPEHKEQWKIYARGDINRTHPDKGKKGLYDKCLPTMPETFGAHQRRTGPVTYRENQREWYQCAKAAGYQLTRPDPETGEFGLTAVGPQGAGRDTDPPAARVAHPPRAPRCRSRGGRARPSRPGRTGSAASRLTRRARRSSIDVLRC